MSTLSLCWSLLCVVSLWFSLYVYTLSVLVSILFVYNPCVGLYTARNKFLTQYFCFVVQCKYLNIHLLKTLNYLIKLLKSCFLKNVSKLNNCIYKTKSKYLPMGSGKIKGIERETSFFFLTHWHIFFIDLSINIKIFFFIYYFFSLILYILHHFASQVIIYWFKRIVSKGKMYSPSGHPRCRWVCFFFRFGEM